MLTSLRLFTRAPCTRIRSWRSATCGAGDCVSFLVALLIVSPFVGETGLRSPSASPGSNPLRAASFLVSGALPTAPPGRIRQREQVQTGHHEQGEREQRHVRHPDDRLLLCQGDESN